MTVTSTPPLVVYLVFNPRRDFRILAEERLTALRRSLGRR